MSAGSSIGMCGWSPPGFVPLLAEHATLWNGSPTAYLRPLRGLV